MKDSCLLRILVIAVHFVLFISMRAKHATSCGMGLLNLNI